MILNFISIFKNLSNSFKKRSILFVIFLICTTILELIGIGIVIPLLEVLSQTNNSFFLNLDLIQKYLNFDETSLIKVVLLLTLIVYIVKNSLLIFFYFWRNKFIWDVYKYISLKILRNFLKKNIEFFFKKNSTELINTTYLESRNYVNCLNEYFKIISETFLLIAISIFLLIFNFQSTAIILIIIAISSSVILYIYKKRLKILGEKRYEASIGQLKNLQQTFFSIRDIKIKFVEKFFLSKYKESINSYSNTNYLSNSILELPKIFFELIFIFSISIVIFFLVSQNNISNENILTSIGVYALAAFRSFPSVTKLIHAIQQINFLKPSIEKIIPNLKDFSDNINKEKNINDEISFLKEITFRKVSYNYPDVKDKVIEDLNFKINKGDFIGLIGKSGEGKTTILDLLMGLIKTKAGEIEVDGRSIYQNLHSWQKKIGYVSQSTILLDDDIKNNIAFGVPAEQIDEKKLLESLKNAQLLEFVLSLPNKLETKVGERGVSLSGGQIQRIGIARELYRDPSLILLDEATSALDTATEKEFLDCLKILNKKMTIIFVSHRESALINCNKILHLKRKKLI